MSKSNYPKYKELNNTFEVIDGKLLRKTKLKMNGYKVVSKPVKLTYRSNGGYYRVAFKGRCIYYHVIIWILHKGDIPDGFIIDHIDGNPINNDINNLRLVTQRENTQNKKIHRDGRLVGTYFHKKKKKWIAQIQINGHNKHLGQFNTELEAHELYIKVISELDNI